MIKGNIVNKSCSTTRVDPKTGVEPYSNPPNQPIRVPKRQKKALKNKSNSNVRTQEIIKNASCSTTVEFYKIHYELDKNTFT